MIDAIIRVYTFRYTFLRYIYIALYVSRDRIKESSHVNQWNAWKYRDDDAWRINRETTTRHNFLFSTSRSNISDNFLTSLLSLSSPWSLDFSPRLISPNHGRASRERLRFLGDDEKYRKAESLSYVHFPYFLSFSLSLWAIIVIDKATREQTTPFFLFLLLFPLSRSPANICSKRIFIRQKSGRFRRNVNHQPRWCFASLSRSHVLQESQSLSSCGYVSREIHSLFMRRKG